MGEAWKLHWKNAVTLSILIKALSEQHPAE